jgi:hypothetical protein
VEISLAIIGTAGRKDDKQKLSKESFQAMCIVGEEILTQLKDSNYSVTHLVSGGAAWADHVAVKLFLNKKVENLRLFIPCQFENGIYVDNDTPVRTTNYQTDYAKTLNDYHSHFQRRAGINSLSEILSASFKGAEILPCKGGFYGRNAMVAKSDIILAMTYGDKEMVKEGGTADTVRRYLTRVRKEGFFSKTFHYNLSDGHIYLGIEVPELKKVA